MTRSVIGAGDVDIWVFDWSDWLARKTEEQGMPVTIASATWTGSDGLIVRPSPPPAIFDSGRQARAWWDAGACVPGVTVRLACRVVTSAGHERTATVLLEVRSR
jgi:hypothetical protein